MKPPIIHLPGYFSDKFLSEMESMIDKIDSVPAEVLGEGSYEADKFRSGTLKWIQPNHRQIFRPLRNEVLSIVNDNMCKLCVDIYQTINALQYASYSVGDQFKMHRDTFGGPRFDRKLTVVIKLNDSSEYRGGKFEFANRDTSNQTYLNNRGSVVVFPSYMLHCVTPVTEGVRKTIVAWVMGPPWR